MTMPAEGVTFLARGLNDLAAAIMYVCTGVWEYGTVRDTVCLVGKNSRRKPLRWLMRQHVHRQLGLCLAEYLCAYFLSLGAPTTYTFRPMLLLPFSLGFSTFSSRRPVHYTSPPLPPPSTLHHPSPLKSWCHSPRLLRLATNSSSAVFPPLCPKTFFGSQSRHGLPTRLVSGKVS